MVLKHLSSAATACSDDAKSDATRKPCLTTDVGVTGAGTWGGTMAHPPSDAASASNGGEGGSETPPPEYHRPSKGTALARTAWLYVSACTAEPETAIAQL